MENIESGPAGNAGVSGSRSRWAPTLIAGLLSCVLLSALDGCAPSAADDAEESAAIASIAEEDVDASADAALEEGDDLVEPEPPAPEPAPEAETYLGLTAEELASRLDITHDFRESFDHGPKPAEYQKYIVLHDTEGDGDAASTIDWWDSNGNLVASHFIINKDGSIVQTVRLDRIAHHAGFGDAGHNAAYGIVEDGRDDLRGTTPIGAGMSDYGMNAWSVGIELVHVGGSGDYPEAQLAALDYLIAAIDGYYGFESAIIDHKDWRTGNSDTSPEFAGYLQNYKLTRTHTGQ